MEEIAREMSLEVEAVPVDRFIPLPAGAFRRRLKVGKFGKIKVYIFDPYSIAVSKIDRGFDTDLDDIIFLLQHTFISLEELERITRAALPRAREFDMNEGEILARLQELKARLA